MYLRACVRARVHARTRVHEQNATTFDMEEKRKGKYDDTNSVAN